MTNATGPSFQAEMKEKLELLFNEKALRPKADTFATRTATEIAQENQGRWAKETTITGSAPTWDAPAGPNWSHDPTGVEPPIDARDCGDTYGMALGEPHEQPFGGGDGPSSVAATEDGAEITRNQCNPSAPSALSDPRRDWRADGDASVDRSADDGAADPVAAGATLPPRTTGSNFKLRKF